MVSVEYLQNYIDKVTFRFNNRAESECFDLILKYAVIVLY